MIPRLSARAIVARDPETMATLGRAATEVGFVTVHDAPLNAARVDRVIETFGRFFHLPATAKARLDMARTGSNRGWGAPGSEQVDPEANPDYKQFFDIGCDVPAGYAHADTPFYAPNVWPEDPQFRAVIEPYRDDAMALAHDLLLGVVAAIGAREAHFADAFAAPMALLRGNFYPERPDWAGAKDFGIATHTDYGCITLLATDGSPGLEVRKRGGGWIPLSAPPGEFIINFGEMLEFWTGGKVTATPHRVVGGTQERISVPLFFNPSYDVNVAPPGSGEVILAGEHLSKRFEETYLHLARE